MMKDMMKVPRSSITFIMSYGLSSEPSRTPYIHMRALLLAVMSTPPASLSVSALIDLLDRVPREADTHLFMALELCPQPSAHVLVASPTLGSNSQRASMCDALATLQCNRLEPSSRKASGERWPNSCGAFLPEHFMFTHNTLTQHLLNRTCTRGVRLQHADTHTHAHRTHPTEGEAFIVRIPKMCYAACLPTTRSPDRNEAQHRRGSAPSLAPGAAGADPRSSGLAYCTDLRRFPPPSPT